jgi:hypothetical protein
MLFKVVCGRVADASPVIGAAMWWHGWDCEDYDKLAYALVAGHLIVSFVLVHSYFTKLIYLRNAARM